jgi:hypothetical protein
MSTIQLNNGNAGLASRAFEQMDQVRRLARVNGHSDGKEVVDSFTGKATHNVAYGDAVIDCYAKVTFDPKKPVVATCNPAHQESSFDPSKSGGVTVKNNVNNTHSLSTIFAPHTHQSYSYSPTKGEHLVSRRGLDVMTVNVTPAGKWTVHQSKLFIPTAAPLVLDNFDNWDARSAMFAGTNYTMPQQVCGQG